MVIASNGNVGIGRFQEWYPIDSTEPRDLLHIQNFQEAAALRVSAVLNNHENFGQLAFEGSSDENIWELSGIGNGDQGDLVLRNVNTANFEGIYGGITGDVIITSQKRGGSIRFGTSSPVDTLTHGFPDKERLTINDLGNVMIGAPSSDRAEKLNVHYDIHSAAEQPVPYAALRLSQSDPEQGFPLGDMYRSAVLGLSPFINGWTKITKKNDLVLQTNSGDIIIAAVATADEPTVDSGVQWDRQFAGAIRFVTHPSHTLGHIEQLTILSNGNVGVGTDTPGTRLDVGGAINFDGALSVDGDAGTTGSILISNGPGLAPAWGIPSGDTLLGWSIGGNSGINDANHFLGTTNAADLDLALNS